MRTLLAFSFFAVFSSCNGQSSAPANSSGFRIPGTESEKGHQVSAPDNGIWIIFQDKQGNYWLGSNKEGAYRYDGHTLTHFTDADGLCSNRILEIKDDNTGNVYLATAGGVCRFTGHTFTTLPIAPGSPKTHEWRLQPGDLWFKEQNGGLYRFDGTMLYSLAFPKHYLEMTITVNTPATVLTHTISTTYTRTVKDICGSERDRWGFSVTTEYRCNGYTKST